MNKEQLIEKYLSEPIKVGECVYIQGLGSQDKSSWFSTAEVIEVCEDGGVMYKQSGYKEAHKAEKGKWKKYTNDIGACPFPPTRSEIRSINFQLESILYKIRRDKEPYTIKGIEIKDVNFNPFVYDKDGSKRYYQRPLVWSDEDKRNLIDSIYNNIDCGKILIRNRGWKEIENLIDKGETEVAWCDVVDGKQRLNAVMDFIDGKFADNYGNYYEDLSENAQRRLTDHQLFSYSELPENSSDESVIEQFLRLNFCGVPQSKEHIQFVKEINRDIK